MGWHVGIERVVQEWTQDTTLRYWGFSRELGGELTGLIRTALLLSQQSVQIENQTGGRDLSIALQVSGGGKHDNGKLL